MIGPKTEKPTPAEAAAAYELANLRDGGRCLFRAWDCMGGVHHDHRKNRSQLGQTVVHNLQMLCMLHHDWKTNHPEDADAQGWGVPGWADPLTYPGRRWARDPVTNVYRPMWVLYDASGGWTTISDDDAERRIAEGLLYEGAS